ncbi:peptide MFS transporter [Mitsuaria sp. 7]|uniref:peptide MFS transporter n=1 Tax=Mitsuaria sp. 7 TaxID=1658665 RepID=UPI0007DD3D6E|nr:peptide MFS transporter [Mitsuaria sp. 7]ANH70567.1 peptide ABC transporter [Mitsuaria sp. 7]
MTPLSTVPDAVTTSSRATWFGQPRGLTVLFLTEMWERFSFYGMSALLVYYMTKQLHFSQADASLIYGLYTGGVFLTPIAGGYLADRWLGRRFAIVMGGSLMAVGHFALSWEAMFYPSLVLIALGNGLFLPNLPSQVGDLYTEDDPRRGGAYNVYYVGVNLGGLLAPLACGTLGEVYGWHWGFGAAGVGMCVGLVIYLLGGKHLPQDRPRDTSARGANAASPDAAGAAGSSDGSVKRKPGAAAIVVPLLLVALSVMVFRSSYAHSGNTLALWADTSVDLHAFGIAIPVTWVQSLNPLFVFLFTPLLIRAWRRAAVKGREPAPVRKMAIGAAGVAAAYLLLAATAAMSDGKPVSGLWLLVFFMVYTIGELYILPVGLGLFARLAPSGMGATVIAAWFLAAFAGNLLSGVVGRAWEWLGPAGFFVLLAALAAAASLALLALGPMLRRLEAPLALTPALSRKRERE